MPPATALEDYLEIVAAIEDTALELKLPVILEGYEPPKDPRLSTLRVTPDPGVIEVNIHPAHSWSELVDQTTHLYQAAHETPLVDREIHARRPPHRHRRRQPFRAGWCNRFRFAVPAPPRPAGQHGRLLAQPPGAELSVFRPVRRSDQPGAAHRRGAQRFGLRNRDRLCRTEARHRRRRAGHARRG